MSRKIKLENNKLKKLLEEKSALITEGRRVSEDVENLEKELEEIDKKIQEEEKAVDIGDLLLLEKQQVSIVEECIEEMKNIKQKIFDRMKEKTSPELRNQYEEIRKKKEGIENTRNKIALKAQKYNDKIIPLGRKLMRPFIEDRFEDYDTIRLEDGEIVATIFSHLDDFKNNFKKK